MAEPSIPDKAKLFVGILFKNNDNIEEIKNKLVKKYGSIDYTSNSIPFTHTDYYYKIGQGLSKIFFSFEKLIGREEISRIKLHTNKLEKKFSVDGERRVNIDPGYLTLSNVFLASCKDFFHRTYIGKGVFLENEYKFSAKHYTFWEWTYPDYKKSDYLNFFHQVREIYHRQLKLKK